MRRIVFIKPRKNQYSLLDIVRMHVETRKKNLIEKCQTLIYYLQNCHRRTKQEVLIGTDMKWVFFPRLSFGLAVHIFFLFFLVIVN